MWYVVVGVGGVYVGVVFVVDCVFEFGVYVVVYFVVVDVELFGVGLGEVVGVGGE